MIVSVAIIYSGWNYANANFVRQLSADEQMTRSDLVIIGDIDYNIEDDSNQFVKLRFSSVKILSIIKGSPDHEGATIKLQTKGNAPEFYLTRCCAPGKKYLMFLENTSDKNTFTSINIDYSIYEIP